VFAVGQLAKATTVDQVAGGVSQVPRIVQRMMAAEAEAETVGRVVTTVTDAASRRLAELAETKLGPPPMPFAFVCFGSQARQEQTANSAQDNALILGRDPTEDEADYFAALARFVCDGLAAAGDRSSPDDVKASNPQWAVSLEQWRGYVADWVSSPSKEAVADAAAFFDVRHLHGDERLTRRFRFWAVDQAANHPRFLGQLAANGLDRTPPVGFFRRFVVGKDGEHQDQLDLKGLGMAPVIELARVMALAERIESTNTFDRLRALGRDRALVSDNALDLTLALERVAYHRLQHQRRQVERGDSPDNLLSPDELNRSERDDLKRAFTAIRAHQDGLQRRFNTGSSE